VVNQSLVLRINICTEKPAHRKSAKRYFRLFFGNRFLNEVFNVFLERLSFELDFFDVNRLNEVKNR